jgi:hypothetical protein
MINFKRKYATLKKEMFYTCLHKKNVTQLAHLKNAQHIYKSISEDKFATAAVFQREICMYATLQKINMCHICCI